MRNVLILLLGITLSACIDTKSVMLDDRTATISSRGGALVSSAEIQRDLIQNAARTSQARGFPYFAIVGSADRTTSYTAINQAPGYMLNTGGGNYMYMPGYASANNYIMPGGDITIRMYRDGEINPDQRGVWSVRSVLAQVAL